MSTFNPTLANTSFIGNNDFFWWLGTVQNADDRDARLGRVKVNILGFNKPDEKPENLPWSIVVAPTSAAMTSGVGYAGNQLKPGSFVIGFFLDYPDCQQPVVIGSLLSKIKPVTDKDSIEARDYPGAYNTAVSNLNATNKGQSAETLQEGKVSQSVAASAARHSVSNPSGTVANATVADAKNASGRTAETDMFYAASNIVHTLATLRKVEDSETKLSHEIGSEEQTIPVESTEGFPPIGILQIGDELVGYTNKEQKKFVLAKRGTDNTTPSKHDKGTTVKFVKKIEYLGTDTNESGEKIDQEFLGTFSDTLVDVKGVIDSNIEFIKDALYGIVNQVKSFMMGEMTKILNAIGVAAVNPSPFFGRTLTDSIMFALKELSCEFDEFLIDSLMSGIEEAINDVVNTFVGVLEGIQCIADAIFESVFSLINITDQVFQLISDLTDTFSGTGEIGSIDDLTQLNVTSVLDFIFSLLGIGCNKPLRDPLAITFSTCPTASLTGCQSLFDTANFTANTVKGRWNPEYSKIIGTFSENGTMVVMDDTPYNSRLVIEHGPSKSGVHIHDNGDVRITNSQNKTKVTIKNENVIIHGDYTVTVDGDYRMKVGKDYHLEVLGFYNLSVNRESKVTYSGEHTTNYKNDAKLEANNGLALVASKLGLSASGQMEVHSPIYTRFTTEINEFNLGSKNVFTTFRNDYIGLNKVKLVSGNNLESRVGTNFAQGLGVSNFVQLGTENEYWGGTHAQVGMGLWSENKLAADVENTTGVTAFNKASLQWESITGAAFKQTTGLFSDNSEGLKFGAGASVLTMTAPLVVIN